jgi:hypothetical protein
MTVIRSVARRESRKTSVVPPRLRPGRTIVREARTGLRRTARLQRTGRGGQPPLTNGPAEVALEASALGLACPGSDGELGLFPGDAPGGVCPPPPLDGEAEPRGLSTFVTVDVTAVVVCETTGGGDAG